MKIRGNKKHRLVFRILFVVIIQIFVIMEFVWMGEYVCGYDKPKEPVNTLALRINEGREFFSWNVSSLSPGIQIASQLMQNVFKCGGDYNPRFITSGMHFFEEQFPPRILVDSTKNVTKRNLYSDISAIRTIVIDLPPTALYLKHLLETTLPDTLPLPWTIEEIKKFAVYLPSIVHKIEESIGEDKLFELTGIDEISDEQKILRSIFQLQTELSQRIATMDSFIVENRGNHKTFLNKIYVYNRMTAMFVALGLLDRKDARFMSFEISQNKDTDILIDIKKRLIGYLDILPMALKTPEVCVFKESLTADERLKYGYVDWLRQNLGDNLKAVVLYGSATRESEDFNDFDNWVVVRDIDEAYKVLKGVALTLKNGKVLIRGRHGKEVSLNIIPEFIFRKIFHFNTVCDRNIDYCKVLYGEVGIYVIGEREMMERSISSVYLRLKTLRAASLWIARNPAEIVGKSALFKYFIKNTQFVMNVCINYLEGIRVVTKDEIKKRLAEMGIKLFEYKNNPRYIAEAMIQTAVDSSFLHNKYLKNIESDLSFLSFEEIALEVRAMMLQALKKNKRKSEAAVYSPVESRNGEIGYYFPKSALIDLPYVDFSQAPKILSFLHTIERNISLSFSVEMRSRAYDISKRIKEILSGIEAISTRLKVIKENKKVFHGFREKGLQWFIRIRNYEERVKTLEFLIHQSV